MVRNAKRRRSESLALVKRPRLAPVRRRGRTHSRRSGLYQKRSVNLGFGFPKTLKMKHRYVETIRLVSSSGVPAFQRFRANGIYDPNQTGVGHQPMYYDQCALLYNHWKVIGSKISVKFVPTLSTTVPQHVGILADDDTNNSSIVTTLQEQTDTRKSAIAWAPGKPTTLTNKFSARKIYGPGIGGNTRLEGDTTADPTEQFYFTIFNAPLDNATGVGVDCIVTIDYIVLWTEQKDIDGS